MSEVQRFKHSEAEWPPGLHPNGEWVRYSDYQEMKDSRDGWERRFHAEQSERRELVGKLNLAHDLASSTKARLEEERDEARKQRDEELRERLEQMVDEAKAPAITLRAFDMVVKEAER